MTSASNARARSTERTIIASAAMSLRNGMAESDVRAALLAKFPWLTTDEVQAYHDLGEQAINRGSALQNALASKLEADVDTVAEGKLPGSAEEYAILAEEVSVARPRRATVGGDVYITVEIEVEGIKEYRTVIRNFPRGMTDFELHSEILGLIAEWSEKYQFELARMTFTIDFIVQ